MRRAGPVDLYALPVVERGGDMARAVARGDLDRDVARAVVAGLAVACGLSAVELAAEMREVRAVREAQRQREAS
jgi:hypothetical protein